MVTLEDYVARIEGTCGAGKDVVVVLRYEKKEEAFTRILKRAQLKNKIAGIIFELNFKNQSFRLYSSGKAIFRGIKDKNELNRILEDLLL
jgi:TATA-box binding protein (TBP) (component of TFIID and TFIIIB)